MFQFRPFHNSDPPHLAEIWRDQPRQRGLMQPISAPLLEQFVYAKQYFDPAGLILALHDNRPVGFVHAGFGANEEQTAIATEQGTTYQLMLRADYRHDGLADELLARGEQYLRSRGAQVIYGGGIQPLNAYYLGLYGGSELPGVLVTDPMLGATCGRSGYREIDRVRVMDLELARFRPPFSRILRQLRRELTFREIYSPPVSSWWKACTIGDFERLRFSLSPVGSDELLASVDFWDIEPLATTWGLASGGMFDLHVATERRRRGLATFLLSEAFERLRNRGVRLIEAQTMQSNAPAIALYEKLGFATVDEGIVYRKDG